MSGILYICGTPIGNLEDISMRALRILKEVDVIAAEDTRHTLKLLNYFEISTPMTSYHEHNKMEKSYKVLEMLRQGKNVALVTDAGMPCISDPGEDLIKQCYENGITVTSAPGPTALTTALALSGLKVGKFIFEGFLPQGKKERVEILQKHTAESRTVIFYEAPHHLKKTLVDMYEVLGERKVALVREITKRFEQTQRGELSAMLAYFETNEPKGEYVIIIEGIDEKELKEQEISSWQSLGLQEHMEIYLRKGQDKKTAMKSVAKDRGLSKSDIYKSLLGLETD